MSKQTDLPTICTQGTHNHVWRETYSPAALKSKATLLERITDARTSGRWLRDQEREWGAELAAEGLVKLCCGGAAATIIEISTPTRPQP